MNECHPLCGTLLRGPSNTCHSGIGPTNTCHSGIGLTNTCHSGIEPCRTVKVKSKGKAQRIIRFTRDEDGNLAGAYRRPRLSLT